MTRFFSTSFVWTAAFLQLGAPPLSAIPYIHLITAVGLDGGCQFPPDLRLEVEAAVHGLPDFWRSVTALSARTFVQTSLSPPGHSTTTASKPGSRPRPKWTRLSLALR